MHRPTVSVGLPVYNGEDYLRDALESLLAQDFSDFEIIISDNASADQTEAICREFEKRDSRIRYFRNSVNIGAARNYNNVFRAARGRFFKWAAHDDECHPLFLSRCVEVLERAPECVAMVYPLAELIDEKGNSVVPVLDRIFSNDPKPHRRLFRILWALNMCDPVFGLIKTDYLKKTQLIGPFVGADYVLLAELAMLGRIWELEEVLFRLRAHQKRSIKANPSARARAGWYDPSAVGRRIVLPDWERLVLELLKSVQRMPLDSGEKFKCVLAVLGTLYWRRFRNFGGRLKNHAKSVLSG